MVAILLLWLKSGKVSTLGPLKPEPNGSDDNISVNIACRTKLQKIKVA
jgi:hypothetical protein